MNRSIFIYWSSEVRMEFIASIDQSSNFIVLIISFRDLSGPISECSSMELGICNAHIMNHISLHLRFTHSLHGEVLGVINQLSRKHDFWLSCSSLYTLFVCFIHLIKDWICLIIPLYWLSVYLITIHWERFSVIVSFHLEVVGFGCLLIHFYLFIQNKLSFIEKLMEKN